MKKMLIGLFVSFFVSSSFLQAANDSPFLNYQNYNHGYCPTCQQVPCVCQPNTPNQETSGPCDPCAPVCGTECGISLCAIGVVVAAVGAAAAIVIASGNGSSSSHAHN